MKRNLDFRKNLTVSMPHEKEIKREKLKTAGQIALNQQIDASGGVLTRQQVATLLNISSSAVAKRLELGHLLVLPVGESIRFPVL